jgi:hypothetical protein
MLITIIGPVGKALTSLSYIPQVKKALTRERGWRRAHRSGRKT